MSHFPENLCGKVLVMAEAATRQPVHGLLTVVRPATDDDVELLVGWHADPEVSRFWDDEIHTAEEIRADYADPLVDHWIVEAAGEPVGFVQSWWEAEGGSTESRDETAAPRRGGLDGFLVPGARGRGLMPDAARALSRSLLAAGWQYVTVDPYVWNEQGLRGWSNAGFVEVSRHAADKDHTAPWVLMRFEDS